MCNQFIVQSSSKVLRPNPNRTSTLEPKLRDSEQCVVLRQVLADMQRHRLEGPSIKMAEAWNSLGLIRLHMQGDAESARECHSEALRIVKELGDKRLLAITLHDLGYCFERMEERELALQQYKEAISTLQGENLDKTHPRMIATQRAMNRILRS